MQRELELPSLVALLEPEWGPICETVGRWVLLVVPPKDAAGTAARLLAGAGQ